MRFRTLCLMLCSLPAMFSCRHITTADAAPGVIFTPEKTDQLHLNNAEVSVEQHQGEARAVVNALGTTSQWPGMRLEGMWTFGNDEELLVDIENLEDTPLSITCRLDRMVDGKNKMIFFHQHFAPKERRQWKIYAKPSLKPDVRAKLFGMRYFPGNILEAEADSIADGLKDIGFIRLYVNNISQPVRFAVYKVAKQPRSEQVPPRKDVNEAASGKNWRDMSADEFFPMIDQYGQFKHEDWPGKVHSDDDMRAAIATEDADLAAKPRPTTWNQYGGWADGPQHEATGHFYPKKINGKWWLVDPEGRLFWSHGPTCVRVFEGRTPITDREHLYEWLPERDGEYKFAYGKGKSAPFAYYKDKEYSTFCFPAANLYRKYGENWDEIFSDRIHRRLSSWGMNTIANWSSMDIARLRRTPYVASVGARGINIEGSKGHWGKFPDPFAPEFAESLRRSLANNAFAYDDPWCIGFFVNNEMSWGSDGVSLAQATVASPATQPAKIAMLAWLQEKYPDVAALNQAWQSDYASWDDWLAKTDQPDKAASAADMSAFYTRIADQYFSTVHAIIKDIAPNKLDLGCRFSPWNDNASRAAARHCDVVSYNLYRYTLDDFALPEGVDMPVMVGEFHFGTLVRGYFYPSLKPVPDQEARRDAYVTYIRSALKSPLFVGAHWFQLGDCSTTGRSDGANAEIGLLTGTDLPYHELLDGVRQVGWKLYEIRYQDE
ncbi:hypothetical protein [Oligosphaera ethanolica]|uniref:Beta-agarase n=1 Tax=Oligosphaera ethanolica TaxID=760260 RepID=A0AAE3VFW4_9BACT|nr:hypothetical protein [Oligosphaera ethanolica]MDQ0289822.1 hypothetical protein [Oligosphaera ethanolica]